MFGLTIAQMAEAPFPEPPSHNPWMDAASFALLPGIVLAFASSYALLSRRALVARDRMVAIVSHELRTPLSGVLGFARLLVDGELPAPHSEHARAVLASGETLLTLVNDILDHARLAGGPLVLQRADVDLKAIVDDVMDVAALGARERGLELKIDMSGPRYVVGDPVRFKQVLMNLQRRPVALMVAGLGPCHDPCVASSPRTTRYAAAVLLGLLASPFAGLDQHNWSPL